MTVASDWLVEASLTDRASVAAARGGATLSAVLQAKPLADDVSPAAWVFLAEALRHSILVRKSIEGVATLSHSALLVETSRAQLASAAVLEELGGEPTRWLPAHDRRGACQPFDAPTLRATIDHLALLIISPRATRTETLLAALRVHLDALRLVER